MKSLTINDIAKLAGVSHSTVSRVLNGHPDVNEKTKQKILAIIKEHNYVPNSSARNLKLMNTKEIGLIIKDINNPILSKSLQMIEKKVYAHQYTLQLLQLREDSDEFLMVMTSMKEKKWKGMIFLDSFYNHSFQELEHIRIPFVFLGNHPQSGDLKLCSSAAIDDRRAAFQGVDYLCQLGHKKIAIIAAHTPDNPSAQMWLAGYQQALQNHHIAPNEKLVMFVEKNKSGNDLEQGYKMTRELLSKGIAFSALFAMSDTLAIGACRAIKDTGFSIPDDISVMGFGGIEQTKFYIPSLCTVQQPIEDMIDTSVDILLQMMEEDASPKHFLFPTSIIQGESCAAPK